MFAAKLRPGQGLPAWVAGRLTKAIAMVVLALVCAVQPVRADEASASKIERLEERVAELEALVQQLIAVQPVEGVSESVSEPAPPLDEPAQTSYGFGGYIKADVMYSNYGAGDLPPGSVGSQFYVPGTIPVGGVGEGFDVDFQARESRINFRAAHETDNGDQLAAFVEMDFFLGPGGDERVSNSYTPRLRHAFLRYNRWTFGQTWTTFQDVGALPDQLDFIGPAEGTVFGRQGLIRLTDGPWEFALENPETTITPFGGGDRIVSDDGPLPDLVGRYTANIGDGYIKVAGLARRLDYNIEGESADELAYGVSVSGKHKFGLNDVRWMATLGSGIGRYLGLNTANDAVLDADGELHAIDQAGGFVAYRHFWRPAWRSSFTLSYLDIDNDTALTGLDVTKSVYSLHANLLYNPNPRLTIGGEVMYAEREIEAGQRGSLFRFLFSTKYGF